MTYLTDVFYVYFLINFTTLEKITFCPLYRKYDQKG